MGTSEASAPGDPQAAAPQRLEAIVRGRVQGVGFRVFVVREAMALGLRGWVANLPDGAVRCVAEGPRPALEELVARLRTGPPAAAIEAVLTAWPPASGEFRTFSVRSGWHGGD